MLRQRKPRHRDQVNCLNAQSGLVAVPGIEVMCPTLRQVSYPLENTVSYKHGIHLLGHLLQVYIYEYHSLQASNRAYKNGACI